MNRNDLADNYAHLLHVRRVIARVTYKDWHLRVASASDTGPVTLALYWRAPDTDHPESPAIPMQGRRWIIEDDATDQEVIQTALLAMMIAEEHENRESFLVDGRHVYGPHEPVVPSLHNTREHLAAIQAAASWPKGNRRPLSDAARARWAGHHDPDDARDLAYEDTVDGVA